MKSLLLLSLFVLCYTITLFGQSPESEHVTQREQELIINPIFTLFDAMRAQDTTKMKTVFINDPYLATISGPDSALSYQDSATLRDFTTAIGSHNGDMLDERIEKSLIEVHNDGKMATAWVPYQFYIGDRFSHCGVNTFIMMNIGETWKITSITDTRSTKACETN